MIVVPNKIELFSICYIQLGHKITQNVSEFDYAHKHTLFAFWRQILLVTLFVLVNFKEKLGNQNK